MPPFQTPYLNRVSARSAGMARPGSSLSARSLNTSSASDNFLGEFDLASAITGGVGLLGDYLQTRNQSLGLPDRAPRAEYTPTGKPVYNVGGYYRAASQADPQGASAGELLGAAGQGAASGFAAAGPVGAVVGGVLGAGASYFGGAARKNKQVEERVKALNAAQEAQRNYNTELEKYDREQTMMQDYYNRLDMTDRLYNLYR